MVGGNVGDFSAIFIFIGIRAVANDCRALFLYKLNTVVLKSTDNIVLSMFLGLDKVALYSNYYIFYTTIQTLFAKIYNSISHSL